MFAATWVLKTRLVIYSIYFDISPCPYVNFFENVLSPLIELVFLNDLSANLLLEIC